MLNSLCITVPGTFLAVYCSCMTAYGIHVYNFKAKKFAWAFIMAIMMVPNQITIIGFYRFMLKLNLVDTYIPLIIPCIAAPAVVFFMKQYMESTLSIEMIEAARIDGAREFRIFNTIIMPIMKPAVATQAIFQFIAQWNNLFTPTIMLTTDEKKTLPLFVQMLTSDQFRVDYGVVYVSGLATVTVLPLIYCLPYPDKISFVSRCSTWWCKGLKTKIISFFHFLIQNIIKREERVPKGSLSLCVYNRLQLDKFCDTLSNVASTP